MNENRKASSDAVEELKRRCTAANIKCEQADFMDATTSYLLDLPAGRDRRTLVVSEEEELLALLAEPFEKYTFIGDYLAIASYELGVIEALIDPLVPASSFLVARRLQESFSLVQQTKDGKGETIDLKFKLEAEKQLRGGNCKLSLCSGQSSFLLTAAHRRGARKVFSLKIENIRISNHDDTLQLLERLADSLFFQIDMLTNIPLAIIRERKRDIGRGMKARRVSVGTFRFPEQEYKKEPLSLYWYAKSAISMPLLQFLAYYQALEFYFPVYSQQEIKHRVTNVLKDPTFDKFKDGDVMRLISAIGPSFERGLGDERTQLKQTVSGCVGEQELREFIESMPEMKDFYATKYKTLSKCRIPMDKPAEDIRPAVAERIYDIRCKIVHTKSGQIREDIELLLPFSKEAEMLYYDIQLLGFLARKVIIANSHNLII